MTKILLFGEPLIRLTPDNYQAIGDHTQAQLFFGGSEINIARTLQGFHCQTKLLTALPDNRLGERFHHFLDEAHIDTSAIQKIGKRIGIYYVENGFGMRPSQVFYDREQSSLSELDLSQYDDNQLFSDVTHLHFSGINLAISPAVREQLLLLLKKAKKRNIVISFDLNWRQKMLPLREAKKLFSQFATYADYCFGIEPLMIDDQDLTLFDQKQASHETIYTRMKYLTNTFDLKGIFHTERKQDDKGNQLYQAYGYVDEQFEQSQLIKTACLERIGSGDAFVAGALYQLTKKATLTKTLNFAVACGALKCTFSGDSMLVTPEIVEETLNAQTDIIR